MLGAISETAYQKPAFLVTQLVKNPPVMWKSWV